jgi:hypothetical protein
MIKAAVNVNIQGLQNGAGDCQRTEWTKSKISKGIYLSLKSATSIWYYQ